MNANKDFVRVKVQVFGFGDFANGRSFANSGSQAGHYDVIDSTVFRNLEPNSQNVTLNEDRSNVVSTWDYTLSKDEFNTLVFDWGINTSYLDTDGCLTITYPGSKWCQNGQEPHFNHVVLTIRKQVKEVGADLILEKIRVAVSDSLGIDVNVAEGQDGSIMIDTGLMVGVNNNIIHEDAREEFDGSTIKA